MTEYIYNRKCGQTSWQVGIGEINPILDIIQSQLFLSPKIKCNGDELKIIFFTILTLAQKTILDNIVTEYVAININWKMIREKRNIKLEGSDWTILSDAPLTSIEKTETQIYRQALRDLPQTYINPEDVIFPTEPSFLEK